MVLSVALMVSGIPATAMPAYAQNSGCNHVCGDAGSSGGSTCVYTEGAECTHVCGEDCAEGCVHTEHGGECGYIKAVPCDHQHNADCGWLFGQQQPEGETGTEIASFATPAQTATVALGTSRADLPLPETVEATLTDAATPTSIPVEWTDEDGYDGDTPGDYDFTAAPLGYSLADGVSAPTFTVTVLDEAGPVVIIGFDLTPYHQPDDPDATNILVETGTAAADIPLPSSLAATVEGGAVNDYSVAVSEWVCEQRYDNETWELVAGSYNPDEAGCYVFTPVLALNANESLADGVSLPSVEVVISRNMGIMPLTQAGAFDITPATGWTYTGTKLSITTSGTYTIKMYTQGSTTTTNYIEVQSGVTATIKLDSVSIDVSSFSGRSAIELWNEANVTLNLEAGTTSTLRGAVNGIDMGSNAQLTIGGSGTLNASSLDSAGINVPPGSTLTINGGTINATAGSVGAGIGGSISNTATHDYGTIYITSGTVNAQGGGGSAGIGARIRNGENGGPAVSGTVVISGGRVTATGGGNRGYGGGAGIGGGSTNGVGLLEYGTPGGNITISGGTVIANGDYLAAGIGGGGGNAHNTARGNLTITGGSVYRSSSTNTTQQEALAGNSGRVYRVRLYGLPANTAVTAYSFSGIASYGLKDVYTDSTGSVYFYLPTGSYSSASLTLSGTQYSRNVSVAANDNNEAQLLATGFVPVTGITLASDVISINSPFTLSGAVLPTNATNRTIVWSMVDAGAGATLSGMNNSVLTATAEGTVKVKATITNGVALSSNYTQDFTIKVENHELTVTGGTIGTDYTYTGGLLTILTSKAMTISGTTTSHHIDIANGVTANLTFDGVSINMDGKPHTPVYITGGAALNLTLTGSNTLTGSGAFEANYGTAGLGVPGGTTLTITAESTGSLSAYGGGTGAGIGGGYGGGCGAVNIHGGTVYAQGGAGAGIGGGLYGHGGAVTITGGNVTANGQVDGYSAGIGTTIYSDGNKGTLTITGGNVKRSGGSSYEATATNGAGTDVYLVTFTVGDPPVTNTAITVFNNAQYGINGVKTDGGGKLYFWLPQSAAGVATVTAGSVYVGGFMPKPDNSEAVTLIEPAGFVAATGITNPTTTINIGRTVNLQATVEPSDATIRTVIWNMTDSGGTGATLSEGGVLSVPASGSAGNISVTATLKQSPYGTDIVEAFTIVVIERDLKIDGGVEGTDYTYDGVLTIRTSTPMTITGTSTNDRIVIDSGVTANITFNSVTIEFDSSTPSTDKTHAPVYLNSNAKLSLTLTGSNKLFGGKSTDGSKDTAGLGVPVGTTLTVTAESTGSLDAKSGDYGAGIGGGYGESCGIVTIQGGTIITGNGEWGMAMRGAGIGGGYGGNGGAVSISGGMVTAFGYHGAGIGGGHTGSGGTVTISGGTVTARSGAGAGIGGGTGGNGGTVTISGGTVTAYTNNSLAAAIGGGSSGGNIGSLTITGTFDYQYNTVASASGTTLNDTFSGQPTWWDNTIKYIWLEAIAVGDPQTISFVTQNKGAVSAVYGDSLTNAATVSVGDTTGTVTYASSDQTVATVAADGAVTILKPGTARITATIAAVPGTWAEASTYYNLTVSAKSLTVTGASATKTYDGDTTVTVTGWTLSGYATGDSAANVSVSAYTAAYTSANAGTTSINVTALTLGGAKGGNYTVTLPANNVSVTGGGITKKDIEIATVAAPIKNWDGTASATAGAVTFTGEVVPQELVAGTDYTASAVFTGGNYDAGTGNKPYTYTVTMGSTAKANNYNLSVNTKTGTDGTINKIAYTGTMTASITVRSGQTTTGKTVALPPLAPGASYAVTGTAGGVDSSLIDGTPSVSYTTLTFNTNGKTDGVSATITIAVTGATNHNNYSVTVTVTARNLTPQTIAFANNNAAVDKTYGDAAFTNAATGGAGSGVTTYQSSDTGVATVNTSTGAVTIVGQGSATITATKAADATYAEATAQYTLNVAKKTLTVTGASATKTYDGDTAVTVTGWTLSGYAAGDSAANVSVSVYTAAYTSANAGTTSINVTAMTLGGAKGGNYTVTLPANNVSGTSGGITKKNIEIASVAAPTKDWDGTEAIAVPGAVTFSGLENSESLEAGTDYTVSAVFTGGNYDAGSGKSYTYTVTMGSTAKANNYNLSVNTKDGADGTINKIAYNGTTTVGVNVRAGETTTGKQVSLPALPAGATYPTTGTASGALIDAHSISGTTLTLDTTSQTDGTTETITINVDDATNYNPYDVIVTVTALDVLQEDTPAASVDFMAEKLTGLTANAAYTVNGAAKTADASGNIAIDAAWFGQTVLIVKKGVTADGTIDSFSQPLTIPARPSAPAAGKADTTGGGSNGSITGVDSTMEYKLSIASAWTPITGASVTGLAAGTYQVRVKATATAFAGVSASVTIASSSSGGGSGGGGGGGSSSGSSSTTPTTPTPTDEIGGNTVTTPDNNPPVTDNSGNTTLPGGGTIETENGAKIDAPAGTTIDKDGNITIPPGNSAEITLPGNGASVTVPGGSTVDNSGTVTVGGGGSAQLSLPGDKQITLPTGSTISEDGKVTVGSGGAAVSYGGTTFNITEGTVLILDEEVPLGYFVSFGNPFTDIKASDWFYDNVIFVYTHGLFSGTSATTFSPGASMTRGMFATVLARLDGADLSGYTASRFIDVEPGQWYAASVEWAADNGIAGGTGGGNFNPNAEITREQMAVMLYNYLKYKGYTIPSDSASAFADEAAISSWAYKEVKAIQKMGIVGGKPGNLYDPQGVATRAEVATIFARFVESVAGGGKTAANNAVGANTALAMLPGKEDEFVPADENGGEREV